MEITQETASDQSVSLVDMYLQGCPMQSSCTQSIMCNSHQMVGSEYQARHMSFQMSERQMIVPDGFKIHKYNLLYPLLASPSCCLANIDYQ